jgi:hypothetical protein
MHDGIGVRDPGLGTRGLSRNELRIPDRGSRVPLFLLR